MRIIEKITHYQAGWLDVGLIKIAVFAAALCLAKLWQPLLRLDWYWYLIIALAAVVRPLLSFFTGAKNEREK